MYYYKYKLESDFVYQIVERTFWNNNMKAVMFVVYGVSGIYRQNAQNDTFR